MCVCGGGSSGAPWPAIWTEIQGLRLSPGPPPRLPPTRSSRGPGTKLIVPPPRRPPFIILLPSVPPSYTFHLIWPAATQMSGHLGKAAVGLQREPPRWGPPHPHTPGVTVPAVRCPAAVSRHVSSKRGNSFPSNGEEERIITEVVTFRDARRGLWVKNFFYST